MATQPQLRFGSLTLCQPSNGLDGYQLTKHDLTKPDAIEISIPGTAGRIKQIVGTGTTEQTSLKLEFSCEAFFDSASELHSKLKAIEARATNTTRNLDTVYYGLMDSSSTFNEQYCDMEFELGEIGQSADGWVMTFRVRFSKWGV